MGTQPWSLLLPFLAALVFAAGSLCFKRAFRDGANLRRSLAQSNIASGLVFSPLLLLDPQPLDLARLGWPMLAGTLFFAAQWCNFRALGRGDVSVVTPVMGTKVLLVALCGWGLFGFPLTVSHWWAAGLTVLGVLVLSASEWAPAATGAGRRRSGTLAAIGWATASSLGFALNDVVIQRAVPGFGSLNVLAVLFGTLGLESALLWPWLARKQTPAPPAARPWLLGAIALTATQGALVTVAIGLSHDATGVNVVYSLRGVWGVVLVWWAGPWFGNTERRDAGGTSLGYRFLGAALILAAVVVIFVRQATG